MPSEWLAAIRFWQLPGLLAVMGIASGVCPPWWSVVKLSLMVNSGPYTHQASDTAWHFACAALAKGHEISRVFFYHDGVNNGTRLSVPPQDERHVVERWTELAKQHDLDLVICVAAAQRRGLLSESEAKRHGKDADNLASGFRLSGLGQLIEASLESDRLVVFGG